MKTRSFSGYLRLQAALGFSLIEVVIFIVIIGLMSSGVLSGINQVLVGMNKPQVIVQASFLANARMNVILLNRSVVTGGVPSLTDPCESGSLAICTPLATYATANGLTVSTSISGSAQTRTISVTVTGSGSNATVQTEVSNYERS